MNQDALNIINLINDIHEDNLNQLIILATLLHNNDDNFVMLLLLNHRLSHLRIEGYFEDWINRYLDYDFFALFRMNRVTFYKLLNKIDCEDLHKNYMGGEFQINAEKQLMITLWWLGKGEVLLSASDRFNISLGSVFRCTNFILSRILLLINDYIAWPDRTEVVVVENNFRTRSEYPGK